MARLLQDTAYLFISAMLILVLSSYLMTGRVDVLSMRLVLSTVPCQIDPNCGFGSQDRERVTQKAIADKQPEICETLPSYIWFSAAEPRALCLREYYVHHRDAQGCVATGDDYCYLEVAISLGDVELCKSFAEVFNLPATDPLTRECFIDIAHKTRDHSVCDQYGSSSDDHLSCRMRLEGARPEICQKFSSISAKQKCEYRFGIDEITPLR